MKHWKRILDAFFIIMLIIDMIYAFFVGLVIFKVEGIGVILGKGAPQIPFETLVTRRLYCIEGYVILGIFILYLAYREKIWKFEKSTD